MQQLNKDNTEDSQRIQQAIKDTKSKGYADMKSKRKTAACVGY